MILPDIKFVPFQGTTRDNLVNYMQEHTDESVFLVYLRCRYEHEDRWEYITDAYCLCNFDDILWLSDWYEGQQHVEYLGITQMKLELKENLFSILSMMKNGRNIV